MKIRIEVECTGSAFEKDPVQELERIIATAAQKIRERLEGNPGEAETTNSLLDVNGNSVGTVTVTMGELKVYSDDTDWYIARSYRDLEKCIEEHYGYTWDDMVGETIEDAFQVIDSSQTFEMNFPDSDLEEAIKDSPEGATQVFSSAKDYPVMEASYAAWIEKRGRGFLASTEY